MFDSFKRSCLWLSILVLTGLAVTGPTGDAAAQGKKNKEPQTLSDAQLADSIHTLRSIRVTLEMANHDYGGHRAAAVRDIGAAVHQLRLALDHVQKGKLAGKGTGKKVPGGKEPQSLSDSQLAEAIPVLKQTHSLLEKANHDYGGHRANAVRDLNAAVTQLEKALAYRAKKD